MPLHASDLVSPPTLSDVKRRLSTQGSCTTNDRAILKSREENASDATYRSPSSASGSDAEVLQSISEGEQDSDHDSEHSQGATLEDVWKELSIKSGYLWKKGERRHAWQKRYFVLRPKKFGYYKDEKEYKLLRDIPLISVRTCAQVQVKRHENVFGIVTPLRTFYVQAANQAEMQDWIVKIDQVAKAAKRAKEEEASSSVTEDDGRGTPHGAGDLTPQLTKTTSQQQIAPPPITIPASHTSQARPISSSAVSSSAMSDGISSDAPEALSSSYTSQNSLPVPVPSHVSNNYQVPPNSLASGAQLNQSIELGNVNAKLAFNQRSNSIASQAVSTTSFDAPSGSTLPPVFRQDSTTSSTNPTTVSAAVVSSSEDEDDPPSPISPNFSSPAPWSGSTSSQALKMPGPDKVILSGYLTKQGKRKNWRKRWFTLSSTCLAYSKSHMDTKIHHQIPLARILDVMEYEQPATQSSIPMSIKGPSSISNTSKSSVDPASSSLSEWKSDGQISGSESSSKRKFEHCFQIITPKRTLRLCATDEESEIKWISAIRVLLAASRRGSNAAPSSPVHLPPILQSHQQSNSSNAYTNVAGKRRLSSSASQMHTSNMSGVSSSGAEGSLSVPSESSSRSMQQRHSVIGNPTVDAGVGSSTGSNPDKAATRSITNPLPSIEGELQKAANQQNQESQYADSPVRPSASTTSTNGRARSATQIGRNVVSALEKHFHQPSNTNAPPSHAQQVR